MEFFESYLLGDHTENSVLYSVIKKNATAATKTHHHLLFYFGEENAFVSSSNTNNDFCYRIPLPPQKSSADIYYFVLDVKRQKMMGLSDAFFPAEPRRDDLLSLCANAERKGIAFFTGYFLFLEKDSPFYIFDLYFEPNRRESYGERYAALQRIKEELLQTTTITKHNLSFVVVSNVDYAYVSSCRHQTRSRFREQSRYLYFADHSY